MHTFIPVIDNHNNLLYNKTNGCVRFIVCYNKHIPEHTETFNVANHIRSLFDLFEQGNFGIAQGMNKDFYLQRYLYRRDIQSCFKNEVSE